MIRPWVKVSLCQYQELEKLRETTRKPLSQMIREAVSRFVRKKDFAVSPTASYLVKGTRDEYKSVSAYFPRSDWNLLERISRNTGECKTELIRHAVDEYLGEWVWIDDSLISYWWIPAVHNQMWLVSPDWMARNNLPKPNLSTCNLGVCVVVRM